MLSKIYRLRENQDFEKVKKEGELFQFKYFAIAKLARDKSETTRYGFVVSKNISKLAVHRNRLKRILSDSVRYNLTRAKDGYDLVFLTKVSIARAYTDDIMKEIDMALKEIGIVEK